jgi:hypothetical protein
MWARALRETWKRDQIIVTKCTSSQDGEYAYDKRTVQSVRTEEVLEGLSPHVETPCPFPLGEFDRDLRPAKMASCLVKIVCIALAGTDDDDIVRFLCAHVE